MIRDMFGDKLLLFVSCIALIITMCFVAMILMDLNNLWEELLKYQQRVENLEKLIVSILNERAGLKWAK
jgi:hypothetical protein